MQLPFGKHIDDLMQAHDFPARIRAGLAVSGDVQAIRGRL